MRVILIAAALVAAIAVADAANAIDIERTVNEHDPCDFAWRYNGKAAAVRVSDGVWVFHPSVMLRSFFIPDCPGALPYYRHYALRIVLAWPLLKMGV